MYNIIGTCSECGGPVGTPTAWLGIFPPKPQCLHCGLEMQDSWGPTIKMKKKPIPVPRNKKAFGWDFFHGSD